MAYHYGIPRVPRVSDEQNLQLTSANGKAMPWQGHDVSIRSRGLMWGGVEVPVTALGNCHTQGLETYLGLEHVLQG